MQFSQIHAPCIWPPYFVTRKNHFFERKVINTANAKMHGWEFFFKDSSLLFETHVEKKDTLGVVFAI